MECGSNDGNDLSDAILKPVGLTAFGNISAEAVLVVVVVVARFLVNTDTWDLVIEARTKLNILSIDDEIFASLLL
jgi:hypothetical protein